MDLIFFGIQGSGKGTQSQIAAEKFDLRIFETGAALRQIAGEASPLGQSVKQTIESGNLVTNEIVMNVVADFLRKHESQRILFDGIPRSLEQKGTFDTLLKSAGRDFAGVLIEISKEQAMARLLGRRICRDCKKVFPLSFSGESCDACGGLLQKRSDDKEQAILRRLENFENETLPAIENYRKELPGRFFTIDGQQSVEAVANEIENVLTRAQDKV